MESPFVFVQSRLYVHLLPAHLGNVQQGVDEKLNGMLLRYSETAGGVVVSYSDVTIEESLGRIQIDMPYIHFHVNVTFLVFAPRTSQRLVGTVSKIGRDHIGLLVCGVFNAVIPGENIRSSLTCADDESAWVDSSSDAVIEIGTDVLFVVRAVQSVNGIMSLTGSLKAKGTGPVVLPDPSAVEDTPRSKTPLATPAPPRVLTSTRRPSLTQ